MTDDEDGSYWQSMQEQEREQQEAADALSWWESQSNRRSENEHRNANLGELWNGKIYESSEFGPVKNDPDSVHQKASSFPGCRLEDAANFEVRRQCHSDKRSGDDRENHARISP